ncbi:hypothetical protein [Chromobacterium vaccinii]|uniref:hypothetical protein n=1 Tax=Chromobacterium vaccinii TaxID=1108595 RepID=UPI001319E7B0|nr:hypothetical protein [Chromobacterium vaccinii]
MKKQLIAVALPTFLLTSLCHADDTAPQDSFARVRVFQQNQIDLGLFPHQDCYRFSFTGDNGDIVESQALKSFLHLSENKGIGMPETPNTRSLAARNNFISKAYYQEYKIPAGEITTLTASFGDSYNKHCNTLAVKFTPQAGTDYEAMLNVDFDQEACRLVIGAIPHDNPDAPLVRLDHLTPATYCPDNK